MQRASPSFNLHYVVASNLEFWGNIMHGCGCARHLWLQLYGIVSLIASEQFAKNPPPRRIGKPSNMDQNMVSGHLNSWISGYLDIWTSGYLDSGKNQFVAASPIRTSVWCSPAGGFFFQKKHVPGVSAA